MRKSLNLLLLVLLLAGCRKDVQEPPAANQSLSGAKASGTASGTR